MSMDGRCLSGDPALAGFWGKWCGAVTEPHTVPPAQGSHSPTGSIPHPGFAPPRPGASKTALDLLRFQPLSPTKHKIHLLKFLTDSFLSNTSPLAWQGNGTKIPTRLSLTAPSGGGSRPTQIKKYKNTPKADLPPCTGRQQQFTGGLWGAGTEGGRSAVLRGCMWQSSFPTAACPWGASPLLFAEAASLPPPR